MEGEKKFGIVNVDGNALGDVANNIINKFSRAVGWCMMPKGAKKDEEIAVETYIREIQNDSSLPRIVKAAKISNARKEIKEYINLQDILQHAQNFGQVYEEDEEEPLDEDWAMFFFDKAKNVSQENAKVLWGKILAEKCNGNTSISKQLVQILSMLGTDEAKLFEIVCNLKSELEYENDRFESMSPIINLEQNDGLFAQLGISFYGLNNLDAIGLIKYSENGLVLTLGDNLIKTRIKYFDEIIEIEKIKKQFKVGNIFLTENGLALLQLIEQKKVDGYVEYLKSYYESNDYIVKIV